MITSTILGLLIPFIGTSLGAACVLFMKNELSVKTTKMLSGFAAGVMIAASVWSLLIPALEQSQSLGKMQFVPAVTGFMLGMFFLLILNKSSCLKKPVFMRVSAISISLLITN